MMRGIVFHLHNHLINEHLQLTVNLALIAPGTPTSSVILGAPERRAPPACRGVCEAHGVDNSLGACPRKKSLKNNALELRGGDLKISHFPETRVLTGDQNFLIFSKNT